MPTNASQRDCMRDLARATSAEVDEVYRRTLERAAAITRMNPGSHHHEAVAWSQKAWEAYRDAECRGVVYGEGGGTGSATMLSGCWAEKNIQRIFELKAPFYQR